MSSDLAGKTCATVPAHLLTLPKFFHDQAENIRPAISDRSESLRNLVRLPPICLCTSFHIPSRNIPI